MDELDYEAEFKSALAGFRLDALGTDGNGNAVYGADYYGVAKLKAIVGTTREPSAFVASLFADALIDAGIHSHAPRFRDVLRRPVLILNSYNILNTRAADISHTYPQLLLALAPKWGDLELGILSSVLRKRLDDLASSSSAKDDLVAWSGFLKTLAADKDLRAVNVGASLGLVIEPRTVEVVLHTLAEASPLMAVFTARALHLEPRLKQTDWASMTHMLIPGILKSADQLVDQLGTAAANGLAGAAELRDEIAVLRRSFKRVRS